MLYCQTQWDKKQALYMLIRLMITKAHTPLLDTALKFTVNRDDLKRRNLPSTRFTCTVLHSVVLLSPTSLILLSVPRVPSPHQCTWVVFFFMNLWQHLLTWKQGIQTLCCISFREATVDMYNKSPHVYHYGTKIHKLYFSEEKAETQKSAIQGIDSYKAMEN